MSLLSSASDRASANASGALAALAEKCSENLATIAHSLSNAIAARSSNSKVVRLLAALAASVVAVVAGAGIGGAFGVTIAIVAALVLALTAVWPSLLPPHPTVYRALLGAGATLAGLAAVGAAI